MSPYLQDADFTLYNGDALEVLRELPPESVQMCVTSPPFFGLRNYDCEGQLGLEKSPEEWCAKLVEVFREVRRVLRSDGVLFLECGDSYASNPGQKEKTGITATGGFADRKQWFPKRTEGIKPKDLLGAPWLLAFALRADGWYLRSDIIWARPNPMPESVTDRPTKSHSYVFLLSKSARYFYDQEGIRETYKHDGRLQTTVHQGPNSLQHRDGERWPERPQTVRAKELFRDAGLTDAHLTAIKAIGMNDAGKAQINQDGYGRNDPEMQRLADEAKDALGGYYREFLLPPAGRNARSVWTIPEPMLALRDDLSEDDRAYVLGELLARGL